MRKTMIKLAAVAAIALGTLAIDGVAGNDAHAWECLTPIILECMQRPDSPFC